MAAGAGERADLLRIWAGTWGRVGSHGGGDGVVAAGVAGGRGHRWLRWPYRFGNGSKRVSKGNRCGGALAFTIYRRKFWSELFSTASICYLISGGKIFILEKPLLAVVDSNTDLLAFSSVHSAVRPGSVQQLVVHGNLIWYISQKQPN